MQLDYPAARTYYEQAASFTPENTLYLNQAGLINQTLADYQKAIAYYEQALASDLKTYGEAHPAVARDRNNLGLAWHSLGHYEKAIDYYELALDTMEKVLKNHPNTEVLRNNLAIARKEMAESETN